MRVTMRPIAGAVVSLALFCLGCQRTVESPYVSSKEVLDLSTELQTRVRELLDLHCGTRVNPKLLGSESAAVVHLRQGAAIYQKRCAACHGVTGDGNGVAAEYLYPRPRDYRRGIFKFTSTPYGAKPRRDDLRRTIRHGAKGTSMPSFAQLPDDEIEAVLDYVLVLTHRGELELQLALEAANEDEISDDAVAGAVAFITDQWKEAKDQRVWPLTKMPAYSEESVALGKKAFLTEEAGCFKCHGDDGRGRTTDNAQGFNDVWGFKTRAADLTAGMFHGGNRPEDIYRRIFSGINGTPMPSFEAKLSSEPDTFWHLVHYVQFVSSARRREVMAARGQHLSAYSAAQKVNHQSNTLKDEP
jgi:mono/diheme cytochrome c family protein